MEEDIEGTGASEPDKDLLARYRCGAVVRYTVGDGLELVYCRNTRSADLLPSKVAALLGHCGSFKTLAEHAQKCCGGIDAGPEKISAVERKLRELVDSGFLISDQDLPTRLRAATVKPTATSAIRSICVPTCNRPSALKRCLESYISNCQQYEKTNDFVVIDDSRDPEVRKQYRQMLAKLTAELGVDVKYAGYEEKTHYLQRLTDTKDLPADIVQFALFGKEEPGLSKYGANQNAILLHTIGDAIFSADDDTICRIAASPNREDGMAVVTGVHALRHDPFETLPFADREAAFRSVNFVDADLLGMHEQFLGRDLASCISRVAEDCPVDLEKADFRFARMITSGDGRVLLTMNGLIGDSAFAHPADNLFLTGASLERLTRSESEFKALSISRECLRAVNRITLSDRVPAVYTTFLGLDNRELLPPFSPVARSQDMLFGHLLSQCFYNAYYLRLPAALSHEPVEPRLFSLEQLVETRPGHVGGINQIIAVIAGSLTLGSWQSDPNRRLRMVGSHVAEFGRLPAAEFQNFCQLQYLKQGSAEIEHLEREMQKNAPSRQYFADIAVQYIKNKRNDLVKKGAWLPQDLRDGRTFDESLELTQDIVRRFGHLVQMWPDIVESARRLRAQGFTLAQPV